MNGLPTKLNLKRRNVVEDDLFQLCSKTIEDTTHALYQCPLLRETWNKHLSELHISNPNLYFVDIARHVQERYKKEYLELFFLIAWGCWFRRNKMIFGGNQLLTKSMINQVLPLQKTFKTIKGAPTGYISKSTHWKLLP